MNRRLSIKNRRNGRRFRKKFTIFIGKGTLYRIDGDRYVEIGTVNNFRVGTIKL